jgi:RND superfamily putative drug exporter
VLLPALLAAIGDGHERGRLPRLRSSRASGSAQPRPGMLDWRRLAGGVIRHPIPLCVGATVGLLLLALPFARLAPSRSDVRALPDDSEPRRVRDLLVRDFPAASLTPISLLVTMKDEVADDVQLGALYDYTRRLQRLPAVDRVESLLSYAGVRSRASAQALSPLVEQLEHHPSTARGQALRSILNDRQTLVRVITTAPPDSAAAQALVRRLRSERPPPGASVRAFGQAAALRDFAAALEARGPWMLATVATAMFIVLLVAFRSLILPLKAMLVTALSLTASFGALVFIFQDGRLESLLRYRALGTTDASLPVVMFAVVFGLSMDYEVLIIGRIREAWLRTHNPRTAVVEGLAQSGRLVTGAALIMIVVFSAFAAAPVVFVKALGLGMALAVALDASVVRLVLVPSAMALLGRYSWWLPAPSSRRRPRLHLVDSDDAPLPHAR